MAAVFVEAQRSMRRRNVAAMLAAITAVGISQTVTVPAGGLTLAGFAPSFSSSANQGFTAPTGALTLAAFAPTFSQSTSGVFTPPTGALTLAGFAPSIVISEQTGVSTQYAYVDRSNVQPRRNVRYQLLAIANPPGVGNAFAIPAAGLTLQAFAPSFVQGSLVFAGQDGQQETFAEYWQPQIRSYLAALQPPGTRSFNIPTAGLTLAAFAPTIGISGNLFVPTGSLTLTAFAPTFTQAASGRIDIPLGSMSLTGFAPIFGVSGVVFVPTTALSLTGYAPSFSQTTANTGGPRYIIKRLRARRWIVSAVTYLQFDPKGPDEAVKLTFDFSPDLTEGITLGGTPIIAYTTRLGADTSPSSIANGTVSIDGTGMKVIVPVQGGIDGCDYSIHALCDTSDPQVTLSLTGILSVRS